MRCRTAMTIYDNLDNHREIPLSLSHHLKNCLNCSQEIYLTQTVIEDGVREESIACEVDVTRSVMNIIELSENHAKCGISGLKWMSTGILILGSIVFISFSKNFTILQDIFSFNIELPLYIVLGVAISLYTSFFAGTHLNYINTDKISKFIER